MVLRQAIDINLNSFLWTHLVHVADKGLWVSAHGAGYWLPVVHPATWLGHQAKGLIGLGFETQCRQGPGGFPDFPNGYLPLRGVNTRIWPTSSNKPSPAWNKDVKSLYFYFYWYSAAFLPWHFDKQHVLEAGVAQ